MPFAIVTAASPECEDELKAAGFKKTEVWLKQVSDKEAAEQSIFWMKHPPFQFLVSNYWSMGNK